MTIIGMKFEKSILEQMHESKFPFHLLAKVKDCSDWKELFTIDTEEVRSYLTALKFTPLDDSYNDDCTKRIFSNSKQLICVQLIYPDKIELKRYVNDFLKTDFGQQIINSVDEPNDRAIIWNKLITQFSQWRDEYCEYVKPPSREQYGSTSWIAEPSK